MPKQESDAAPPYIRCTPINRTEVRIVYDSPRRICHFAKCIISGIGRHYQQTLDVRERPACTAVLPIASWSSRSSDAPSEHASGRIA